MFKKKKIEQKEQPKEIKWIPDYYRYARNVCKGCGSLRKVILSEDFFHLKKLRCEYCGDSEFQTIIPFLAYREYEARKYSLCKENGVTNPEELRYRR